MKCTALLPRGTRGTCSRIRVAPWVSMGTLCLGALTLGFGGTGRPAPPPAPGPSPIVAARFDGLLAHATDPIILNRFCEDRMNSALGATRTDIRVSTTADLAALTCSEFHFAYLPPGAIPALDLVRSPDEIPAYPTPLISRDAPSIRYRELRLFVDAFDAFRVAHASALRAQADVDAFRATLSEVHGRYARLAAAADAQVFKVVLPFETSDETDPRTGHKLVALKPTPTAMNSITLTQTMYDVPARQFVIPLTGKHGLLTEVIWPVEQAHADGFWSPWQTSLAPWVSNTAAIAQPLHISVSLTDAETLIAATAVRQLRVTVLYRNAKWTVQSSLAEPAIRRLIEVVGVRIETNDDPPRILGSWVFSS